MRYDKRVTVLIKSSVEPYYDPDLGQMVGDSPKELILPCHVSEQGLELREQLNEKLELDAYIIRLRQEVAHVDKVILNGKHYRVVTKRAKTLYVEEVRSG